MFDNSNGSNNNKGTGPLQTCAFLHMYDDCVFVIVAICYLENDIFIVVCVCFVFFLFFDALLHLGAVFGKGLISEGADQSSEKYKQPEDVLEHDIWSPRPLLGNSQVFSNIEAADVNFGCQLIDRGVPNTGDLF